MADLQYVTFNVVYDPDFVCVEAMESALTHLGEEFEEFTLSFDTEQD